jgi:hypothetical protein
MFQSFPKAAQQMHMPNQEGRVDQTPLSASDVGMFPDAREHADLLMGDDGCPNYGPISPTQSGAFQSHDWQNAPVQ